jgi:hypothetical protein
VDLKPLVESYGGRHEAVSGREEFLAALFRKQIDDPFFVIEYQSEITQLERVQEKITTKLKEELKHGRLDRSEIV